MPVALLVGFEYNTNSLPGVIVDLYRANSWCELFDCDIYIITDNKICVSLDSDYNKEYLDTMLNKELDEEEYLKFKTRATTNVVHSKLDISNTIIKILNNSVSDGKTIIYYTGHGIQESLKMPDDSLFPFVHFRDTIIQNLSSYNEIFCVLDCCNPNGMHLPYKLINNQFKLSSSKVNCIKQPMMLITSAESHEKSIAKRSGSIFSCHLFRLLTDVNNRNLKRMLGLLTSSIRKMETGFSQTVSIYSSYILDPVLWTWIGETKDYDIVSDMSLSMIILRINNGNYQRLISNNTSSDTKEREDNNSSSDDSVDPVYFNPYDSIYKD